MTDRATPSETDWPLLTRITDLVDALTATVDEPAVLDALLGRMQRGRPDSAALLLVDPRGDAPATPRVAAAWRDGQVVPDTPDPAALGLPDDLWSAAPTPRYAVDAVVLPLHNAGHGGWLGALRLAWSAPHAFTPDERAAYGLLSSVLAAHLGGLRTQQALRATLAERELLHELTRRFNLTTTLDERLQVLRDPAPSPATAEMCLCTIESDAAGAPTWITVVAALAEPDRPVLTTIGARHYLPTIPLASLYMATPDTPTLIPNILQDPRVDATSRATYAAYGVRATILLPLTLHGRWVGLVNISWPHPVALGEREQRIYQSLARHAALLLDNSLMLARLQATLASAEQQGELLQTVLDHIPVGVVLVGDRTGKPALTNATANRLVGSLFGGAATPAHLDTIVYPDTDRPIPPDQLTGMRVVTTGAPQTEEVDILAAAGDRTHLEVVGVPMFDERRAVKNVLMVLTDITARKRAARERLHLQDEVIRVQAAALAERSSPIIPITDDILVLPLIGSIDVERGQQVLSTLLEGASQRRARVAVLDITGVTTLDTQAAAALTGAARALRLLGVEPILSGIRPDVAQTMIQLGADLGGVTTCGTLQSAIQHALRRLGRATL